MFLRNTNTDEDIDWVANTGLGEMLKAVRAWFNPPRGPHYRVIFRVKHRPSGRCREYPIIRHKQTYRVFRADERLTLAEAQKKLKEEVFYEHCERTRLP